MDFGIPTLRVDKLAAQIPERVYVGGLVVEPASTLFIYRSCTFPAAARGGVLSFYVDDFRFECLWRRPDFYAERFAAFGWGAVVEPDFSTWVDAPLVEQLFNIYRMRTLGRLYQEHGIDLIPNLAWSDERSFDFAFAGIPIGAPVVACEARTAGQNDDDRRAFLRGLAEGVKRVRPERVLIYGGAEHTFWLSSSLPAEPRYTLITSWTHVRDRIRAGERKQLRSRNQGKLFPIGGDGWADEDRAAVGG